MKDAIVIKHAVKTNKARAFVFKNLIKEFSKQNPDFQLDDILKLFVHDMLDCLPEDVTLNREYLYRSFEQAVDVEKLWKTERHKKSSIV